MANEGWKLFYWHFLPGRGDYVRLIFEEAGVQYEDVCMAQKSSEECLKFCRGEHDMFPVIAPPIIQRGEFVMNETPAILQYLGKKFGLYPDGGLEEEAHAMQIMLVVTDYHAEGHDAFHPVKKSGTYDSQKEEAKPQIAAFKKDRMPRYLNHLEQVLKRNNEGRGFFLGDKLTYVDIAVFHVLRATEFQFPEEYMSLDIPLLHAFKHKMQERSRIKAFLESERSQKFCGNSMM